MALQSLLAKAGLRFSTLGSAAALAVAAPLAEGSYDPAAHTSGSRIGHYYDRSAGAEKIGFIVLGSEGLSVAAGGIGVGGQAPSTTTALATPAGTTGVSSLRLPHGTAPTTPVNGDMWTTTAGLFVYINGGTVGPLTAGGGGTIGGSIAATQVAVGSGVNTVAGSASLTWASSTLTATGSIVGVNTVGGYGLATQGNSGAALQFYMASAGTDLKTWDISADSSGNTIALRMLPDVGVAVNIWSVLRNGASTAIFYNYWSVQFVAATTSMPSLNIPQGVQPSSPNIGDIWATSSGVYCYINGGVQLMTGGGTIGGSIANGQVAVGSGTNTVAGSSALTFSTAAGFGMALGATAVVTPMGITGSINNYFESNNQNTSNGTTASSDFVATADTGTATTKYIDLGINSSGYTGGVFGTALEGYLYTSDDNLNIGAATAGKVVRLLAGGSNVSTNTVATIASTGVSVTGSAGIQTITAATQDGWKLVGRAGGTSSFLVTLITGTLTGSITLTSPLVSGTLTTGSGTANQVATWSGTNALTGAATLTLTVTSGASLLAHAAGTSTATTTTAAAAHSVTYSGIFTTGPTSAVSGTATFSGATATSSVILTSGYFTATATGAITNANSVNAVYGALTATPGGAAGAINYVGVNANATVTSAANVFFASASLLGALTTATFNTANTTGVAVAAAVAGHKIVPSVVTTNASGTNTIAAVYGEWIAPGTFSSTGGGGLTITNFYGLFIGTLTLTTMTVTNRYGVYQQDTAAQNFFAGIVGVGNATPSATTALITPAGATGVSSLRLPHGVAPSAPVNGDMWTTTAGIFVQINGATVGPLGASSGTIGGSIAVNQVAFGSGTNTIQGDASVTLLLNPTRLAVSGTSALTTAQTAIRATGTISGNLSSTGTPASGVDSTQTYSGSISGTPVYGISATMTFSGNTTSQVYGLYGVVNSTPNAATSGGTHGIRADANVTNSAASSNTTSLSMRGATINSVFTTAATAGTAISSVNGIYLLSQVTANAASGTQTVTAQYGIYVSNTTTNSAAGGLTVTNSYGLYLDVTTSNSGGGTLTITNRYGVYQADTNSQNFFAGIVGVGNATPSATTALITPAGTTGVSSLRVPHGAAPTSPVNGDVWSTTAGMFARVNGTSYVLINAAASAVTTNQVAFGSAANVLTSDASYTATVANGIATVIQSGTSTATTSATMLTVNPTFSGTGTGTTFGGILSTNTFTAGGGTNATSVAISGTVSAQPTGALTSCTFTAVSGTANTGTLATNLLSGSNLYAGTFSVTLTSSATTGSLISNLAGVKITPNVTNTAASGSVTVGTMYGLWVAPGLVSTSTGGVTTTVTNFYGVYIAVPATGGSGTTTFTNLYGIYQADSTALNALLGKTGAGIAPSTSSFLTIAAATTAASSLRMTSGTAPTSPVDGDMWYDGTNVKFRVGGTTKSFTLV